MKLANYKLDNLLNAVRGVSAKEGLDLQTVFKLAYLLKELESKLTAFYEVRKGIIKKYVTVDKETKQQTVSDQAELQREIEELSLTEVDFPMADEEIVINIKEDSDVFTVQLAKTFVDVFGEKFKVTERSKL